jgi:hypothetical protein
MKEKDLIKKANQLLSQNGFSYDGSPKKSFSKKQKFFEKKTVIITPMGNGMR